MVRPLRSDAELIETVQRKGWCLTPGPEAPWWLLFEGNAQTGHWSFIAQGDSWRAAVESAIEVFAMLEGR